MIDEINAYIDANPNDPDVDKLEDVRDKLFVVLEEMEKDPPDNQAAVGNIEGAVGDLETLDGFEVYKDHLAGVARELAVDAVEQAIAVGGDLGVIAEAQQYLSEGDALRVSGSFKDAINKYKDALAKAESVL